MAAAPVSTQKQSFDDTMGDFNDLTTVQSAMRQEVEASDLNSPIHPLINKMIAHMSIAATLSTRVAREHPNLIGAAMALNADLAATASAAAILNFKNGAYKDGVSNVAAATAASSTIVSLGILANGGKAGNAASHLPDRISYSAGILSTVLSYIDPKGIEYSLRITGLHNLADFVENGDDMTSYYPGNKEEDLKEIKRQIEEIERKEIERKGTKKSRSFLY